MKIKFSVNSQIMLALVLAVVAGYFLQDHTTFVESYIRPLGIIFLNLLKFIVVPLVFLSIAVGILSMEDVRKVGKLGLCSLLYFMITTVLAVTLGLFIPTLTKGWFPHIDIPAGAPTVAPLITFRDQLIGIFPHNIIEPILNNQMMQVIVIAVFFGVAIVHVGEKAKAAREVILSFNEVVARILSYIMTLAPIGVFCMLTPVVAVNGPRVLGSYAVLIGADFFCFFLHALIVYTAAVHFLGKCSPFRFFQKMSPALLFGFSSDSSVATLPYTIECAEKLGVKRDLGSFVLSLGATINMDGVAIYLGVTSVFIATCCGIDLTIQQYLALALSATVASVGTPGIPGGSLALMAMVFASAGIPVEGVAIAAGIDRLVDMGRTTMSIAGDASCAVVMQRLMNNNKDQ